MRSMERFQSDPLFHNVVMRFLTALKEGTMTPKDLQSAATLAISLYSEEILQSQVYNGSSIHPDEGSQS